jgi:hypothetical protein
MACEQNLGENQSGWNTLKKFAQLHVISYHSNVMIQRSNNLEPMSAVTANLKTAQSILHYCNLVRFEVLTEIITKATFFWSVTPCNLADHANVLQMLGPGWTSGRKENNTNNNILHLSVYMCSDLCSYQAEGDSRFLQNIETSPLEYMVSRPRWQEVVSTTNTSSLHFVINNHSLPSNNF